MSERPEPPLPAWQIALMWMTLGILVAGALWVSIIDLAGRR